MPRDESRPDTFNAAAHQAVMKLEFTGEIGATVIGGRRVVDQFQPTEGFHVLRPERSGLFLSGTDGVNPVKVNVTPTEVVPGAYVRVWCDPRPSAVTLQVGAGVYAGAMRAFDFVAGESHGPIGHSIAPQTVTTEEFDFPATGQTAEVAVADTDWMLAGEKVRLLKDRQSIEGEIESVVDATHFVFQNLGAVGNPAADEVIERGHSVTWWTSAGTSPVFNSSRGNSLTLAVGSSALMTVGQTLFFLNVFQSAGIHANFYFNVISIPDATHVELRQVFPVTPFPAAGFASFYSSGGKFYPARIQPKIRTAEDNPYAITTGSILLPTQNGTVDVPVTNTDWMVENQQVVLNSINPFVRTTGVVEAIIDNTHFRFRKTSAGAASAVYNPTNWGAIVSPFSLTTSAVTLPVNGGEVMIPVSSTSWIIAPERRELEPVWTGYPVLTPATRTVRKINDLWFAARDTITAALYRVRGDYGLCDWSRDWGFGLTGGVTGGAINSVVTDGETIFAGGSRARLTADDATIFSVAAFDGDGEPIWRRDVGATVNQLIFADGKLFAAHDISGSAKNVTRLNPETGEIIWQAATESRPGTPATTAGSLVWFDGSLYVGHNSQPAGASFPSPPSNRTNPWPGVTRLDASGSILDQLVSTASNTVYKGLAASDDYLFVRQSQTLYWAGYIDGGPGGHTPYDQWLTGVNKYDLTRARIVPYLQYHAFLAGNPDVYAWEYPWTPATVGAPIISDPSGQHVWMNGRKFDVTTYSQVGQVGTGALDMAFLPDGSIIYGGAKFDATFHAASWANPVTSIRSVCAFGDDVIYGGTRVEVGG